MKAILIATGSSLGAVIIIATLLFTVDLGRFKDPITSFASDYLGRTIEISGDLSIRLGDRLRVSADDLRLASTSWAQEPDLLTVRRIDLTLDYLTLLSDVIVVDAFVVSGIQANLEVNATGANNYSFPGLEGGSDNSDPTRVFLTQGGLNDVVIEYRSAELQSPLVLGVSEFTLQQTPEDLLAVSVAGALNDAPISATGHVGSMDNLMQARNVRFDLTVSLGGILLTGSGLIDDLTQPALPEAKLLLDGPSAEYITDILELDAVTSGPIHLDLALAPDPTGLVITTDGVFGEFTIDLDARLTSLQDFEEANVSLASSGPSLATLGRLAGREDIPEEPFTLALTLQKSGSMLSVERLQFEAGDATLTAVAIAPELPGLAGATADVTLQGLEFGSFNRLLGLPGNLTGPFQVTASLVQTDGLGLLSVDLVSNAIEVGLNARISDEEDLTGSTVLIEIRSKDLSLIATALDIEDAPDLAFGAEVSADIERAGVRINTGSVSFAQDTISFSGMVGRDPMATITRLEGQSTLPDLAATLAAFKLGTDALPVDSLDIAFALQRGDSAFLLAGTLTADQSARLELKGHIGDSLELPDMHVDLEASGANLADLLPANLKAELEPFPEGPFTAVGRISFSSEDIQLSDGRAEFAGASVRTDLRTPLAIPFETASIEIDLSGESLAALLPQSAEVMQEDPSFSVTGQASWTERSVSLKNFQIQAGEARMTGDGQIALSSEVKSAITLETNLPTLRAVQFLFEQPLPDEPMALDLEIRGDPENMTVNIHNFSLGASSLTAEAILRLAGADRDVPEFEIHARSPLLDLTPLVEFLDSGEEASEPLEPASDGRIIPDLPLPLEALGTVDGKVDFLADRLITPDLDVTDVTLRVSLSERSLQVERASVTGATGTLGGSLNLVPSDSGADLNLRVDGTNLTLGLPAETPAEVDALPRYELTIKLDSQGTTVREHAGTATGYVKAISGTGQIDLAALGLFTRDFAGEVMDTVNPFATKETHSHVQCMGILIEMTEGVLFGDPAVVFQTDKLNIAGVGKVNLTTEKLNATFNTRARKGLGISMSDIVSPYTEIGGSLASPRLQLNSKSAIFRGSATIATAGISFLAKKAHDRFIADRNPCRTEILKAEEDLKSRGAG